MIYYNNHIDFYNYYWFSLILLNILIYLILIINFFLILFLFDLNYLKTLNEINFLNNLSFLTSSIVFLILSFAGIPPFLGFLGKFLTFIYIFAKNHFFIVLIFLFINLFSIYFYIQNLKFIISKNSFKFTIFKKNNIILNKNFIFFINFINFINFFFIFFLEDLNIFLFFINSFVFLN